MGGGGGRPRHAALKKQASKESIGLVASRDYELDSQTYSISPTGGSPAQPRASGNNQIYKSYNINQGQHP